MQAQPRPVLSRLKKKHSAAPRCAVCVNPRHIDWAQISRIGQGRPVVKLFSSAPVRAGLPEELAGLRKQGGLDRFRITTLLEPRRYQLHLIDAPDVPEAELQAAVRWRLKDLIDYPPDAATVDVLPVPSEHDVGSRAKQVFAVSARNDDIAACMRLFDEAGLALGIIDIPELAQRNVAALYEEGARGLALLGFGDVGGLLTITAGGELYVARNLEATSAQIETAAGDVRATLFERIVLELQRSLDHFDRQFGGLPVVRLLLAPVPGAEPLRQHLADNLYLPVELLDLTQVLDLQAVPALAQPEVQARALHVIGAALRDIAPDPAR